ncbi:MAG TPA: hypothetical protein VJB66_02045 [Candidatus Nanoarchaeia archaeon]|nr:hypothetical protein [Candidatus Nanoarchaeia archaeon]
MATEKQMLMEGWLKCRIVIELMGKPKEHIEQTMQKYIEKIKTEEMISVLDVQLADATLIDTNAQEEGQVKQMWTIFAELEMLMKEPKVLTTFCLNYMPASIEIIEPEEIVWTNQKTTMFFNDLQARLHQLDMIAKQTKTEVVYLRKNIHDLLKNYVTLLLRHNALTAEQLSKLIGVKKEILEDFLDTLIDKEIIVMDGEKYRVKTDEKREPSES